MFNTRRIKNFAVGGLGLGLWTQVFAFASVGSAGNVTYEPVQPEAIPTLSQWALVALSTLMAAWAYRALRAKAGGRPLASMLLLGALSLAVASGQVGLPVQAVSLQFSLAAGGVLTVGPPGESDITNTSGIAQRITAVTDASFTGVLPVGTPRCVVGLVVAPGAVCYVRYI